MRRLVEFPLSSGESILVEVNVEESGGMVPAASRGLREKAQATFEEALAKVRPAAETVLRQLREMHQSPDEIQVEFGLKLSAEAGAIIAASGMEANYKITLTWKRDKTT